MISVFGDDSPVIDVSEKKTLQLRIPLTNFVTESGISFGRTANLVHCDCAGLDDSRHGRSNQVRNQKVEDAFQCLVELQLLASRRIARVYIRVGRSEHRN